MTNTLHALAPTTPNRRSARVLSAAVLAAAALVLSACGSGDTDVSAPQDDASAQAQEETDPTGAPADSTDAAVDSQDDAQSDDASERGGSLEDARAAVKTAEAEKGGTAHTLDWDDSEHWEIDVIDGDTEWEFDVSADGSTIESTDKDSDDDDDDRRELERAEVSLIEAAEAALKDTPGTLDEVELDEDDGMLHWDVTVYVDGTDTEREIRIDALTGDVLHSESDDDDNDDDNDDD